MPVISAIVPAYNSEKTIRETIESVLNQSFSDFELIVINDGSTDSTEEIANSIQDPRLKVFSYPHAGGAVSRNRGFSHSSGEFIAFLDADDLWTPDKLEAQLKALQDNPKAAVAYSWLDSIDESGHFVRPGCHITANGDVYAKLFLRPFVESGSNPLIRREAFIEVGGFDESLPASQDYDLYLKLAARYDFVAVPATQILYRFSSNSMSTNIRMREETSLLVRKRAFDLSPRPLPAYIKQHSIANFYKEATGTALNISPNPLKGLEAARLLFHALRYDPSLVKTRAFWKALLKIAVVVLLPPKIAQLLMEKMKRTFDVSSLFMHVRQDPYTLK